MPTDLIERNIKDCPNYCAERKKISDSDDRMHLLEVNGLCPVCGNTLIEKSGKKTKHYEIAHIYPNKPTPEESKILNEVTVLGENSESFQNKIALCLDCHKNYDFHKTVMEYNVMLNKKRELYNSFEVKSELANIDLTQNIICLLNKISEMDFADENLDLRLSPLELKQKFSSSESILKRKVMNYVTEYFLSIKSYFENLENTKQLNFSRLATTIRLAYQTSAEYMESKTQIFDSLVEWLLSKTNSKDSIAAESIISYFVQDCEVFDEITK